MTQFLTVIRKNLHYLILVSIGLGLANVYFWGGVTIPKNILVAFVVLFVIYPVMINTKFEDVLRHFQEPRPLFCSLFINFGISPLIAYGIGTIFLEGQPEFFTAFILLSLIPTSAMSAAWTSFSGARLATALYLIPANLLFAAFIGLPFILPFLIGNMVKLKVLAIIKNVLLVFGLPLVAGDLTRRLLVKWKGEESFSKHIKPNLGNVSALGVFILVLMAMSQKRNTLILSHASILLKIIIPIILYYVLLYLIGILWAHFLTRRRVLPADRAIVIVYTSVARHINISLALVLSAFTAEQSTLMILFILAAYIVQVPSLAFYSQKFGIRFIQNHRDL